MSEAVNVKPEKVCLIVSGGEFADIDTNGLEADFIIACDRGVDHADRCGIRPDLALGDFDSVSDENLARIQKGKINNISYPSEKDETDTLIAVKHALKLGYRDIRLVCAFGKRMDHTLANIQTAQYAALRGAVVRIYDKAGYYVVFADSSVRIKKENKCYLSVFSLSDKSMEVSIKGTKYEIEGFTMTNDFPIGESNEFKEAYAEISVLKGVLMVMVCREVDA